MQRDGLARLAPDEVADGVPKRPKSGRYDQTRLADRVLAYLPQAVAVFDQDMRLLFWNAHAAALWGMPPHMAAERPTVADAIAATVGLAPAQRERLVDFCADHIRRGDGVPPDTWLRLTIGRTRRFTVQIHGMGRGIWMMTLADSSTLHGVDRSRPGDAWLDALTGLRNRRQFEALLHDAPEQGGGAVLLLDIDGLQKINETHGREVGDALLCLVARRLERALREDDVPARVGGDEFAVLVPNDATAAALADRLLADLHVAFQVEGTVIAISAAIGIAHIGRRRADQVLAEAAAALAEAKTQTAIRWIDRASRLQNHAT
jgi:diguanylate cyclase (GGDEF)-like protein